MTFRLDLVNRAGLFRHYAAWHEDGNCADQNHVVMAHRIGLMVYSLEKLHYLRDECLEQFFAFSGETNCTDDEILFDSPGMFEVFSTFSTTLLSQRLCQNALMDLLGQKLGKSLPSSMSDFVKNPSKHKLPNPFVTLIQDYWSASGREVKAYRDVDQHFGLVARHAWIKRNADTSELMIYLPDNPHEKSLRKFSYTQGKNVFQFCDKSFHDIHELTNGISKELGYNVPRSFDYNINFPADVRECMMIGFDASQSVLVGREIFRKNGQYFAWNHVVNADLGKYSFVKLNGKFPQQYTFSRDYELSDEPAFITEVEVPTHGKSSA
ncbi:hypothetical protein [Burkholderia sp. NLJ2]|uniref:hypothetical protein n=1 Tax=Burkholderia sp. NLJ2 TaxID=3090699 RepID=UPI003C6C6DCC